jgi:hypothetical protein
MPFVARHTRNWAAASGARSSGVEAAPGREECCRARRERVRAGGVLSARQLSLDQEFAWREARLFTSVIGYQFGIMCTSSLEASAFGVAIGQAAQEILVRPTALFVLVVSSKLTAGSATRSMSQDRMIWDPGSASAHSPDSCATRRQLHTRRGAAKFRRASGHGDTNGCALLSFSGRQTEQLLLRPVLLAESGASF